MDTPVKKTPLHAWHVANGGNMVDFGEYNMPLWYAGAKQEHLAVLTHAGMFDTSHMAAVQLRGAGAFNLLQRCFTRDLNACLGRDTAPLVAGRCIYGAFLNTLGQCIDDAIVYKVADDDYLAVVNAGMGFAIARHLEDNRAGEEVEILDLTDRLGKFDLQGPASVRIMRRVLRNPEAVFDKMVYFSFKGHFDPSHAQAAAVQLQDGTPLLLSRSGYTGEVGFEVFIAPENTRAAWEALMAAGADLGVQPCGLASRDSLRTGAGLPLSHQDIGHWFYLNHPWCFALPYTADGSGFSKSFVGAEALLAAEGPEHTLAFAGYDLRKVDVHDAAVLDAEGAVIGSVLTCATDIAIGRVEGRIVSLTSPDAPEGFKPRGLCCGFVKVADRLEPGTPVELKDKKRHLEVEIVSDIRPARTGRRPLKEFF